MIALPKVLFGEKERTFAETDGVSVSLFRYDTGVEAVRLSNERGHVIVLPFLGQMLWEGSFDGVRLGLGHHFPAPRPAHVITGTYGCLTFHSGLLANGCPSLKDTHQLHGEFSCASLESAALEIGRDTAGSYVRLHGTYEFIEGFGPHYLATPSVTLRPGETQVSVAMQVENHSYLPMDLMYMCHINMPFVPGGRILQGAAFTPENVRVRTAIPAHVHPSPAYRALLDELAHDPGRMATLDPALSFDPEQVFYVSNLPRDGAGLTQVMLRRPEGDGFLVEYDQRQFPYLVRWLYNNPDTQVAAIALPATCYPEGHAAEKAAGRVRELAPGAQEKFCVSLGYLDRPAASELENKLEGR